MYFISYFFLNRCNKFFHCGDICIKKSMKFWPKGANKGQFGNKRFKTIAQEMSNWEEAH